MEYLDLILSQASGLEAEAPVVLHDTAAPGIVHAAYAPAGPRGETVDEEIALALNGSEAQIRALLSRIVTCLERGAAGAETPGGLWCYLRARSTPGAERLRSKVLSGWVELPGGVDLRSRGGQRARLHLRRVNYWEEEALRDAALVGIPAAGGFAQIVTFSGDDFTPGIPSTDGAGAALVAGELPAPAWVEVRDDNPSPAPFHCWAMESAQDWGIESQCAVTWRGGVSGSSAADPACVDGSYLNLGWSGAGEVEALQIDADQQGEEVTGGARWRGQPYRLMLRLRSAISTAGSEAMWARWKLYLSDTAGESFVMELEPQQLPQGEALIAGPVVNCPPWAPQGQTDFTVRLVLSLQAAGSGSHALQVDAAWLAALDGGWRFYHLALAGSACRQLRDDPYTGLLVDEDGTQGHAAEGPGLWLYPWQAQHFHFFFMQQGGLAPVGRGYRLAMKYRPRRRCL